jgi:hypothetical protein
MLIKLLLLFLAICGILLGGYLTGLVYSTNLNPPVMNSIFLVLGPILSGISALYLIIKFFNKITKQVNKKQAVIIVWLLCTFS